MYERIYNVGLPTGAGPIATWQSFELPSGDSEFDLTAWISNFGSSNVHLMETRLALAEAQGRLESGLVDCIMTLTSAGPTKVHLKDSFSNGVGVFFEAANTSGQFQVVTLRVHKCTCAYR